LEFEQLLWLAHARRATGCEDHAADGAHRA
jgi:hypothetical protein